MAFSKDDMLRKGKSAVDSDLKKCWNGIEAARGVKKEVVGLEVSLVIIQHEERDLAFAHIESKTPVLRSALQFNHRSL